MRLLKTNGCDVAAISYLKLHRAGNVSLADFVLETCKQYALSLPCFCLSEFCSLTLMIRLLHRLAGAVCGAELGEVQVSR